MTQTNNSLRKNIRFAVFLASAIMMLVCEVFRDNIFGSFENSELIYSLTSRFFGSVLCFVLVLHCGFSEILKPIQRRALKNFLFVIPCWLIAINNFPILSVLNKDAYIQPDSIKLSLLALQCLLVGIFEELAYRGCVFMLILKSKHNSRSDIFSSVIISSALFGAIHLVNLAAGANPVAVLLQVGYSFLIGAMCSFVLIKTGNIWHCALIHAVYNFCGAVVGELGGGTVWTVSEIILTAAVATAVTAYVFIAMMKIRTEEVDALFHKQKELS